MTKSLPPKSMVLYVDDDADDRDFLREAFTPYKSIELKTFSSGRSFLNFLHAGEYHKDAICLVIIDINMPELNGKEVLTLFREVDEFKDTPAILFSTSTMPQDAHFAHAWDAIFITKPINTAQMQIVIEEMIDNCISTHRDLIRKSRLF